MQGPRETVDRSSPASSQRLAEPAHTLGRWTMPSAQTSFDIIDFHNHHIPARFKLTAAQTQPATQRARWEMLARKLPDEDLLLRDVREGHLRARVVNIPANLIADAEGHVPHETIMAMNDDL